MQLSWHSSKRAVQRHAHTTKQAGQRASMQRRLGSCLGRGACHGRAHSQAPPIGPTCPIICSVTSRRFST